MRTKKDFLQIPTGPGLYLLWEEGSCVYIGLGKNIQNRVSSGLHHLRTVIRQCESITWIECCSSGMRDLEKLLIKTYLPKYNISGVADEKENLYPIPVLKCSPSTLRDIKEYSENTGVTMRRVVDDMASDWLQTVGAARLEAMSKITMSQFEKK